MINLPALPGARRLRSLIRRILGPSTPVSSPLLPGPSSSLTFSLVTPLSALHLALDPPLLRLSTRLALQIFLYPTLCLWAVANVLLIRQHYYLPSSPAIVDCTYSLWNDWPPDTCGLNATDCATEWDPSQDVEMRCMGGCRDVSLGNPRWIGGEEVDGVPLVIGGGDAQHTYRADSWICASALHSSLISDTLGGCVRVNFLPYPSGSSSFSSSSSNGIVSSSFSPPFPGVITLSASSSSCIDLHPIISPFNAITLFLTTILLRPPPSVLFSTILLLGYFQISLLSDPTNVPPVWEDIVAGLLPVIFTGYWMFRVAFKRTHEGFRDLPFELGLWQGLGYWIGVESSTIFAKLPISRLGYGSLPSEGVITLVVILAAVVVVLLFQAWDMRKAGMLQYYIVRYLPFIPILLVLALVPNYTLRLHHYLYALVAIPVLSLPNRISLFGQAFMLGLFLDGVGRWGWASIIQVTGSLLGDAAAGTLLPTFLLPNATDLAAFALSATNMSITNASMLAWTDLTSNLTAQGVTGWNLLVDDVLRVANTSEPSVDLASLFAEGWEAGSHYFRLAYFANGSSLDFTDPVTRWVNGSWG